MARKLIEYMEAKGAPRCIIAEAVKGLRRRYSHKFLNDPDFDCEI